MRWFWIDRFLEFEHGRRAVAVKNVALAEEQVEENFPGHPVMPASLIIEGLAQTGGLLLCEYSRFRERVVLAKVGRAEFHREAYPGDQLRYQAVIESIQSGAAVATGTAHIDGELCAEIDLVFAELDESFPHPELFEPAEFLRMLRILKLFDVGRNADGSPVEIPEHMLAAERALLGRAT